MTEIARTFLRLSFLGFGGPNAHISLMLEEVVERRRWLTREHFLDLLAITHLLPGPNSSEMAIHVGFVRGGWRGAVVAGSVFLGPTFLMVLGLSAVYFRFGTLPAAEPLMWALRPVVVALILRAGWKLSRASADVPVGYGMVGAGLLLGLLAGEWLVMGLLVGGVMGWSVVRAEGGSSAGKPHGVEAGSSGESDGEGRSSETEESQGGSGRTLGAWAAPALLASVLTPVGLVGQVFWTHLWIGCVLFGGGYVLIALLEPVAVGQFGWLTAAQFLDGTALTQAVPGPISTLSTFVGYSAAGIPGAVAGTLGIYLPAFLAVLLVAPHLDRVRESRAARAFLGGMGAVAAGGILGVGLDLGLASVQGWVQGVICVAALVSLVKGWLGPGRVILLGLALGAARLFAA
jgi:chromate transporter